MLTFQAPTLAWDGYAPPVVVLDKDDVLHPATPYFNRVLAPYYVQHLGVHPDDAVAEVEAAYHATGDCINYLIEHGGLHGAWDTANRHRLFAESNALALQYVTPNPALSEVMAELADHGVVFAVLTHNYTHNARAVLEKMQLARFVRPSLVLGHECLAGASKTNLSAGLMLESRLQALAPHAPRVLLDDSANNMRPLPALGWHGVWIGEGQTPPPGAHTVKPDVVTALHTLRSALM
jgi:FMN phosphatase YigB (HAD superfamily)